MSDSATADGAESGLQILNNIGYVLGVPFLLILGVIMLVWWQYQRRQQRIAALTGQGGVQGRTTTSVFGSVTRYRRIGLLLVIIALLWWQWDWVVGVWQSEDWLGQLASLVRDFNALGVDDIIPFAVIFMILLVSVSFFWMLISGDIGALKDSLWYFIFTMVVFLILYLVLR